MRDKLTKFALEQHGGAVLEHMVRHRVLAHNVREMREELTFVALESLVGVLPIVVFEYVLIVGKACPAILTHVRLIILTDEDVHVQEARVRHF